jgi:hypothetical protein
MFREFVGAALAYAGTPEGAVPDEARAAAAAST